MTQSAPTRTVARCAVAAVVRVGALLLCGAMVSIGAAWAVELVRAGRVWLAKKPASELATWYEVEDPVQKGYLSVGVISGLGREEWTTDRPMVLMPAPEGPPGFSPSIAVPSWFCPPEPGERTGASTRAMGLPWRCMKWEMRRSLREIGPGSYAMQVRRRGEWEIGGGPKFSAVLPLLPIWPGLAGDSVVVAVLLASPFLARGAVRRRRERRGWCVWCGYDTLGRRDRPCPECGRSAA